MALDKNRFTRVSAVTPGGIADELGVKPGDVLLRINGKPIMDVFEYRLLEKEEYLELTFFLNDDQAEQTVEIEKDENETLGMEFEEPMMCNCNSCHNHCIFCFIDQLPKGMRPSLYFKDDDMRMSFLTGNYVTLTNLSEEEFERLLTYHLSPMNISVHATDPETRRKMLHNKNAGQLMDRMRRIADDGIEMNCQFVLCPGINDGEILEQSLRDLDSFGDSIKSIACVPVGLTRYREQNRLFPLERYNKETAGAVLDIVEKWQDHFLKTRGTRLFYAGDEFYIRAQRPIPPASEYEDYPQLENGVGLISDYINMTDNLLKTREVRAEDIKSDADNIRSADDKSTDCPLVWEILGTDALEFHQKFAQRISKLFDIIFEPVAVDNDFFGHTITVTGLLTGQDIVKQLNAKMTSENRRPDLIVLSYCMLKADEDIFLDDMTLDTMKAALGVPVTVTRGTGNMFEQLERKYIKGEAI